MQQIPNKSKLDWSQNVFNVLFITIKAGYIFWCKDIKERNKNRRGGSDPWDWDKEVSYSRFTSFNEHVWAPRFPLYKQVLKVLKELIARNKTLYATSNLRYSRKYFGQIVNVFTHI